MQPSASLAQRVLRHSISLLFLLAPASVWASTFPPITDAERALNGFPGEPGAVAVVLYKKADLKLRDYPREVFSRLEVETRIKILKDEGKDFGEIAISHSRSYRLKDFDGRTVLPDGTEVPVEKDSIFIERSSRARKSYVTKIAFPKVEAGAILDYRYVLTWDSLEYLEPWYFHNRVPTLLSEIVFDKPDNMGIQPWSMQTTPQKIQSEDQKTPRGVRLRVWVENLPSLPDEPSSFPMTDLSSRFMIVPTVILSQGTRVPLYDSWKSVHENFDKFQNYAVARRKDNKAKKKAQALAAGAGTPREKAEAVYRFVRDEVVTLPYGGIYLFENSAADRVLSELQGTAPEQAVLLQAMLAAVKIKSKIIWATDRREGRPDLSFPNPWWFDHAFVRVDFPGGPVFLDPSDRRLVFGQISPYNEGTWALVFDRKNPEVIALPQRPYEENGRRAVLALELDEEGRVSGSGTLTLSGHHAWLRLEWREDEEKTVEAWSEWLDDEFEGFMTEDVTVAEDLEGQEVRVSWKMTQREEDVLGDETSLQPSLPLGPIRQIFTLPANQRLTPVWFSFGDRDEVELTVTWPESWELDLVPDAVAANHEVGELEITVDVDEASRRLTYRHRFDIHSAEFAGRDKYAALKDLFEQAEKSHAQELVLVLR